MTRRSLLSLSLLLRRSVLHEARPIPRFSRSLYTLNLNNGLPQTTSLNKVESKCIGSFVAHNYQQSMTTLTFELVAFLILFSSQISLSIIVRTMFIQTETTPN